MIAPILTILVMGWVLAGIVLLTFYTIHLSKEYMWQEYDRKYGYPAPKFGDLFSTGAG